MYQYVYINMYTYMIYDIINNIHNEIAIYVFVSLQYPSLSNGQLVGSWHWQASPYLPMGIPHPRGWADAWDGTSKLSNGGKKTFVKWGCCPWYIYQTCIKLSTNYWSCGFVGWAPQVQNSRVWNPKPSVSLVQSIVSPPKRNKNKHQNSGDEEH